MPPPRVGLTTTRLPRARRYRRFARESAPGVCRKRDDPFVSWPRDEAKLDRVRTLMAEEGLDALVVRAPDSVLYLTHFWGMKGYEAVVFPREGEPTLICLEASAEDAERTAWTTDVRFLAGYAPDDPVTPSVERMPTPSEIRAPYIRRSSSSCPSRFAAPSTSTSLWPVI